MSEAAEKRIVNLYLEANPNPNSLKFVANFMLVPEGQAYDFPTLEEAQNAPLAQELFQFSFVKRVFYMNNFVTVTKVDDVAWEDIQVELRDHIKAYLEENKALLINPEAQAQPVTTEDDPEIVQKIKTILDEYIKPAVEMDGGAISFHDYEDGIVTVALQGSCSGCPSSTITLKAGIENLFKRMLPEVQGVQALEL